MPAYYAIALLIAFYALVIAEVLIPSGGLLGSAAVVVALTSVIIGFTHSLPFAVSLSVVYIITTPVLFAIVLRLWPKTRIGRKMLNRDTLENRGEVTKPTTLDGTSLEELVGYCGQVTADLLPHGQIRVEGHKANAVSTGLPIEKGTAVWTIRVQGNELLVRTANATDMTTEEQATPQPEPIRSYLEEVDLESFDGSQQDR